MPGQEKGQGQEEQNKSFRFQANPMSGAQEVLSPVGDPNGFGIA